MRAAAGTAGGTILDGSTDSRDAWQYLRARTLSTEAARRTAVPTRDRFLRRRVLRSLRTTTQLSKLGSNSNSSHSRPQPLSPNQT